jgi:hypothetical protein
MFAFPRGQEVDLFSTRCGGAQASAGPKEDKLSDVPKVKADATPVWAAILSDFVPDDLCLVGKAPPLHYLQALKD